MLRLIVETGGGSWYKRVKTLNGFMRQTSVLSACIATCSCEKFSIPILLYIAVYLILLITTFYTESMIVNLTFQGRKVNLDGIAFFSENHGELN